MLTILIEEVRAEGKTKMSLHKIQKFHFNQKFTPYAFAILNFHLRGGTSNTKPYNDPQVQSKWPPSLFKLAILLTKEKLT